MARPRRLEAPGVVYHVIARGNERKAVFRDDVDRERYLSRLAHYREKFHFKLLAFCLMNNHVHLALETGQQPLSRIMAGLQSSYTQSFNRRHRRAGHLFQGRYKAFVVEKDRYLLALVRYVHDNPVRARVVERSWRYPWSSDRFYQKGSGPPWLDLDIVLAMLGRGKREATRRYRSFMAHAPEQTYEKLETMGQIVKGDEGFARSLFRRALETERGLLWPNEKSIAAQVARTLDLPLDELRGPGRRRTLSRGRALAAYVGKRFGRISFERMGRYLGRDGSTLLRGASHLETELETAGTLRKQVAAIVSALRSRK